MEDNMEIVKYLQEYDLLIEDVRETIENEVKEQKGRFLSFLLVTLKASLLGNLFSSKVGRATGQGGRVIQAVVGVIRVSSIINVGSFFN